MGFVPNDPINVRRKILKFVALPVPEIIAIDVFGWRLRTPNLGEGEAGRTTCNRSTALCTIVHRAVKTEIETEAKQFRRLK